MRYRYLSAAAALLLLLSACGTPHFGFSASAPDTAPPDTAATTTTATTTTIVTTTATTVTTTATTVTTTAAVTTAATTVTTTVPKTTTTAATTVNVEAQKKEQAMAVAKQIADSITGDTDLERVSRAAAIVAEYSQKATYTTEGRDYSQAYGVFIKGEYSCAGSTRALGMVLTCMGYTWQHANENQWTHQWCILEMDGQIGYADGQVGWAGYGSHPVAAG